MRKTHIIATIGPATESLQKMKEIIEAGVDIFRCNFSHGTYEWFERALKNTREASVQAGKKVTCMLDTKGPEIRTGDLSHPLALVKGDDLIFTTKEDEQDPERNIIFVNYQGILEDIKPGDIVELDNGHFEVEVLKEEKTRFHSRVLSDAHLGSRKHINLPGIRVGLPTISKKDIADIKFGLLHGINSIAISFVRSAKDVQQVRDICNGANKKDVHIYAKIENKEGVENFDEILESADGIMVARGDLGVELPYEQVPSLQKMMVKKARKAGKYSIVATQMLSSMITDSSPTRAEVSDVATAVWEHASAVMLSGETATGKYPVKTVSVMKKIIEYTENERIQHEESEVDEEYEN